MSGTTTTTTTTTNTKGQNTVEGMEVHDIITDNDLFRFFLNEDELTRSASEHCSSPSCSFSCSCSSSSSPDSSQSGSMSSPEPEFESPPSSPSSPSSTSLPYVEVKTEKDTSFLTPLWPSSLSLPALKEEPKDILQSFSFAGLDLSSPISLDMAVNALDQELKKRKSALSTTKIEGTSPSKTNSAAVNNNTAALSREDLLKLSSKSLDSYATINSNRSLTEDEERQLKRQRRLIKNRESAQLSRQRKRLYIEELEKKVTALSTENNELMKQVTLVTTENTSLKDENFQLQSFIKQLNEAQKKSLNASTIPTVKLETVSEIKSSATVKLDVGSPVAPSSPHNSAESAATVVPNMDIEEHTTSPEECASHSLSPLYYYLEHPEELRKILGGASKKKGKKRKKEENFSSTSSVSSISSDAEETSSAHIYFCPEAQELKTADKRSTRANSGKSLAGAVVSFLLPYSSVYPQKSVGCAFPSSSSPHGSGRQVDSTLVELSCQVLETKSYPLSLPLKCERVAAVSTSA